MTKKRFDWRIFLILWLASILGVIAIVPYSLSLQAEVLARTPPPLPLEVLIPIQLAENAILFAVAVAAGLFFANRIGLGAPLLEAKLAGESIRGRLFSGGLRGLVPLAVLLGVIASLLIVGLDVLVFAPAVRAQLGAAAPASGSAATPPAWQGFLASFYGGIDEEILLRLFLLSLLAFLGKFISHTADGRPGLAVLWAANLLAAILFGLGHLPTTSLLITITPLVVARAVVLNGLAGVAFGYLYFTRGLEAAMLSHFTADLVLHVLLAL